MAMVATSVLVTRPVAPIMTSAEDNPFRQTEMVIGSSYNFGSIGWADEAHTLKETSEFYPDAKQYQLFRNVLGHGEYVFGAKAMEAFEEDDMGDVANSFHLDKTNINLYASSTADFTVPYDMLMISELKRLAESFGSTISVPALMIEDEIAAMFTATESKVYLVTPNEKFSGVGQTWHVESVVNYVTSGGSVSTRQVYYTDVRFTFHSSEAGHISEITTLSYGDYETEQDSTYTYDFNEGYIPGGIRIYIPTTVWKCVCLPYEITYFQYESGEFNLGHSAYGERYGTAFHRQYLKDITLTIIANGVNTRVTLSAMTSADYHRWQESDPENLEEYDYYGMYNKFAYLSRPRNDDEVGGEGSLVRAYYVPFKQYEISRSSRIKVRSMTFYTRDNGLSNEAFIPDAHTAETYEIPNDLIQFNYYAEKATARCYTNMVGINISNEKVVEAHFSPWEWWRWVAGILTGGVSEGYIAASEAIANGIVNDKYNAQRFYFNVFDMEDQLIPNVFKLDFAYQKGRREVNVDSNGVYINQAKKWDDLDTYYAVAELTDSEINRDLKISGVMFNVTSKQNGFVSVEDDPHEIAGKKYQYYYQNVYETEKYSDFMCWWDPLSIWYTTEGTKQTIRATTTKDGTYVVQDAFGDYVVMDLETGEPTGQDFEEWINTVETNNTNEGIADGEKNNTGINLDGFTDWWNQVVDAMDQWKVVIGIALGAVGIVLIVLLLAKLFGSAGGTTVVKIEGPSSGKAGKRPKKKKGK